MNRSRKALRIIRAGVAMVFFAIAVVFEALGAIVEEDYRP